MWGTWTVWQRNKPGEKMRPGCVQTQKNLNLESGRSKARALPVLFLHVLPLSVSRWSRSLVTKAYPAGSWDSSSHKRSIPSPSPSQQYTWKLKTPTHFLKVYTAFILPTKRAQYHLQVLCHWKGCNTERIVSEMPTPQQNWDPADPPVRLSFILLSPASVCIGT